MSRSLLFAAAFSLIGALTACSCAAAAVQQPAGAAENRDQLLRQEAAALLAAPTDSAGNIRLIMIDLELSTDHSSESRSTCRLILRHLAVSGDDNAAQHVRTVFENEPERRSPAAFAISQAALQHPSELQDWRLMVRSLPILSLEDAPSVLQALRRYRIRANKSQWVRHVILTGLRLPEDQRGPAVELLRHWTTLPVAPAAPWSLAEYQEWFRSEYPEAPAATLPVDQPGRRWTMEMLLPAVLETDSTPELSREGAAVYDKAGCRKCHQRSSPTPAPGPDLTSLGWRRQKFEILQALLHPSQDLHEEYPSVTVQLTDGTQLSGLLQAAPNDLLAIVNNQGERREIPRKDVEFIRNQPVSNMPEGTLEPLTQPEILALMAYLTSIDGVPRPHSDEE
jgi:putative heme-binding domain-containing protein